MIPRPRPFMVGIKWIFFILGFWDQPMRTPAEKQRKMTFGAKAERHNPAAAITEPGDNDVDGACHQHHDQHHD